MMVALGNFFFRFRTTLSPLLLLFLFLPGPALFGDPFVAAVVGLVVAAGGQVVRGTTIGLRYIVRGGRGHRVYADDLVTEGLFQHTRNPMYVGKFFMVLGAGVASNSGYALIGITAAYLFMYHSIVLAEEAYLRAKFGSAFDDYCRRVPRWLPRFEGLARMLAESEFHWTRVLVKEYSAPLGWILPIVAFGLDNMSKVVDLGEQPVRAGVLLGVLGAATLVWLIAGWLKKFSRSPAFRASDT
jgi:protein-S-isoprenylcysteine O-methyltransferase Ste14